MWTSTRGENRSPQLYLADFTPPGDGRPAGKGAR
jgi:hypothetical protein